MNKFQLVRSSILELAANLWHVRRMCAFITVLLILRPSVSHSWRLLPAIFRTNCSTTSLPHGRARSHPANRCVEHSALQQSHGTLDYLRQICETSTTPFAPIAMHTPFGQIKINDPSRVCRPDHTCYLRNIECIKMVAKQESRARASKPRAPRKGSNSIWLELAMVCS